MPGSQLIQQKFLLYSEFCLDYDLMQAAMSLAVPVSKDYAHGYVLLLFITNLFYFGIILRIPQCQWKNPGEYEWKDHVCR